LEYQQKGLVTGRKIISGTASVRGMSKARRKDGVERCVVVSRKVSFFFIVKRLLLVFKLIGDAIDGSVQFENW